MSIFPQSPRARLERRTCRSCLSPALPNREVCAFHASEAGRLALYPQRAGYRDPAYLRARRRAIARAGGNCESCGEPLEETAPGRVSCQTHHVDGDATNNTPENLLVCCHRCHSGRRAPDERDV